MINNYSFNLDRESERDVLIHGTAHYSKNWTAADQKAYNKKYYQEHKEERRNKKTGQTEYLMTENGSYTSDPSKAVNNPSDEDDITLGDYISSVVKTVNNVVSKWASSIPGKLERAAKRDAEKNKNMSTGEKAINTLLRGTPMYMAYDVMKK